MAETLEKSTETKIVELYDFGYSQKEISDKVKVSPQIIRGILKNNGFETRKFRALDEQVTSIIISLVKSGVYFAEIEDVCGIAFHAIRDVVARYNLQNASRRARGGNSMPMPVVADGYLRNPEFLKRYLEGESFCALCKYYELSDEQILNEFLSIDKDQVKIHKAVLKDKIIADATHGFSTTSIARRHTVSMSIVRGILRDEGISVSLTE